MSIKKMFLVPTLALAVFVCAGCGSTDTNNDGIPDSEQSSTVQEKKDADNEGRSRGADGDNIVDDIGDGIEDGVDGVIDGAEDILGGNNDSRNMERHSNPDNSLEKRQ